ncbi:MAG TPA: ABC transporter ATP-binding protein [Planctomycetota bacterium]|nr:ABC transporter ATP-binding protein [Planctomycetota bacterium]
MSAETVVRVQGLGKTYRSGMLRRGFRALNDVSLEVKRGTVFGLLGPNGAGKTTLVKILLGLVRGWEGEAEIFGERAGQPRPRRRIGYLPENHRLPGYLTGRQALELFGLMCGRDTRFLRERIPPLLERVDMRASADRKLREYSKGMQQRIGLAQAMVHEPELLILDEPTDGVDPVGRAAIREMLVELKGKGTTIFINSHLLMEVELMCDRVVIMDKGRVIREGSIAELTPRTGIVHVEIEPVPADLSILLDGVGAGLTLDALGFEIRVNDQELDRVIDTLRGAGVRIRAMSPRRMNLEQAFIDLVRREPK